MIKVTVNNEIKTIKYNDSKDLDKEIGCYEFVYPVRLDPKFVMVVDENGYSKNLNINTVGSYYYGSDKNGYAILGDILLLRVHRRPDGYHISDITEQEENRLLEEIKTIINIEMETQK